MLQYISQAATSQLPILYLTSAMLDAATTDFVTLVPWMHSIPSTVLFKLRWRPISLDCKLLRDSVCLCRVLLLEDVILGEFIKLRQWLHVRAPSIQTIYVARAMQTAYIYVCRDADEWRKIKIENEIISNHRAFSMVEHGPKKKSGKCT